MQIVQPRRARTPRAADGKTPRLLTVICGNCGKTLHAQSQFAGRRARCPGCGNILELPATGFGPPTPERIFPLNADSLHGSRVPVSATVPVPGGNTTTRLPSPPVLVAIGGGVVTVVYVAVLLGMFGKSSSPARRLDSVAANSPSTAEPGTGSYPKPPTVVKGRSSIGGPSPGERRSADAGRDEGVPESKKTEPTRAMIVQEESPADDAESAPVSESAISAADNPKSPQKKASLPDVPGGPGWRAMYYSVEDQLGGGSLTIKLKGLAAKVRMVWDPAITGRRSITADDWEVKDPTSKNRDFKILLFSADEFSGDDGLLAGELWIYLGTPESIGNGRYRYAVNEAAVRLKGQAEWVDLKDVVHNVLGSLF